MSWGAAIVGNELQGWAAVLAQKAMNETLKHEMGRQSGWRKEAFDDWSNTALGMSSERATEMMAQAALSREGEYSRAAGRPFVGENVSEADRAAIDLQSGKRAKLGAYGDWTFEKGVDQTMLQELLNRIISKSGGSMNVFPYRMQSAQQKYDWLKAIGQSISSLSGFGGASTVGMDNQQPTQPTGNQIGQSGYVTPLPPYTNL